MRRQQIEQCKDKAHRHTDAARNARPAHSQACTAGPSLYGCRAAGQQLIRRSQHLFRLNRQQARLRARCAASDRAGSPDAAARETAHPMAHCAQGRSVHKSPPPVCPSRTPGGAALYRPQSPDTLLRVIAMSSARSIVIATAAPLLSRTTSVRKLLFSRCAIHHNGVISRLNAMPVPHSAPPANVSLPSPRRDAAPPPAPNPAACLLNAPSAAQSSGSGGNIGPMPDL